MDENRFLKIDFWASLKNRCELPLNQKREKSDFYIHSAARKNFPGTCTPTSEVSARFKTKEARLAEVAKLHNAKYCVIILTKHEGEIFEKGTISIFEEYGKQSAQTRYTRERMTFDEHHRYVDENYANVTTNRLKLFFFN